MILALRDETSRHDACRSCTGAPRRDFLLGLRRGRPAEAHVPKWCSRHGYGAGHSRQVGPPGLPTPRSPRQPGRYRIWRREAALALNGMAEIRVSGKGSPSYVARLPTPTGRSVQQGVDVLVVGPELVRRRL